jgi:hypothetical protein
MEGDFLKKNEVDRGRRRLRPNLDEGFVGPAGGRERVRPMVVPDESCSPCGVGGMCEKT